jgi:hypothetical protein
MAGAAAGNRAARTTTVASRQNGWPHTKHTWVCAARNDRPTSVGSSARAAVNIAPLYASTARPASSASEGGHRCAAATSTAPAILTAQCTPGQLGRRPSLPCARRPWRTILPTQGVVGHVDGVQPR